MDKLDEARKVVGLRSLLKGLSGGTIETLSHLATISELANDPSRIVVVTDLCLQRNRMLSSDLEHLYHLWLDVQFLRKLIVGRIAAKLLCQLFSDATHQLI